MITESPQYRMHSKISLQLDEEIGKDRFILLMMDYIDCTWAFKMVKDGKNSDDLNRLYGSECALMFDGNQCIKATPEEVVMLIRMAGYDLPVILMDRNGEFTVLMEEEL